MNYCFNYTYLLGGSRRQYLNSGLHTGCLLEHVPPICLAIDEFIANTHLDINLVQMYSDRYENVRDKSTQYHLDEAIEIKTFIDSRLEGMVSYVREQTGISDDILFD